MDITRATAAFDSDRSLDELCRSKIPREKKIPLERPLRILSPYRKGNHALWLESVEVYEPLADEVGKNWGKKLPLTHQLRRQLLWAWRLFRLSRNYDVILTGSDRMGLLFGLAQRFFRRRRVAHIYLDFLINREGGRIRWGIWRLFARLAVEGASCALVQRGCEVAAYSQALGVSPAKFKLVPYHATIFDLDVDVRENGYVFAGGDSHRDYPVLVEAVRDLPYRVIIACLRRDHFAGIQIPKNVEIVTVPAAEFLSLMAGANVIVVPLGARALHVGGEQTYLNAMTMGKPTIVTDAYATDYIANGVTGILTPAGDVGSLKDAIKRIMDDRGFAQALAQNGKQASADFTPQKFFSAVFGLCRQYATKTS